MFTPLQFSQLAAAAWHGPAATVQTSACVCVLESGFTSTLYSTCYTLGKVQHSSAASSRSCPFAAAWSALWAAFMAGVLTAEQFAAGEQVVEQACNSFGNVPAPQGPATCAATPATAPRRFAFVPASCAACGEAPDHFGLCSCSYVPVPQLAAA